MNVLFMLDVRRVTSNYQICARCILFQCLYQCKLNTFCYILIVAITLMD